MKSAENIVNMTENMVNINEAEADLPHLLNELSFSYSVVYSAQQSLDDLDKSIQELGALVEYLKEQTDKGK